MSDAKAHLLLSLSNIQAYYILDELFIGGELQESSKKEVLRVCSQIDDLCDVEKKEDSNSSRLGGRR